MPRRRPGEASTLLDGRYADQVGLGEPVQAVRGLHREAHRGLQRTVVLGAHREVDGRHAVVGAVDPEGLAQDPELEGRHAVEGEDGDIGQHPDSLAAGWQQINAHRLFCHWWQDCYESMITAMTTVLVLLLLIAALGALIAWVRHDGLSAHPRAAWFD